MKSSYLNSVFSSASGRARLSLLQVSITGILWGTTGVVVQVVAERTGLGALAIGFYRLAFAAVVLSAIGFPARRRIVAAFRATPVGVIATGVGLAGYQALYFLAVRLGGVTIATVVSLGIAPVLLSAWESWRERRRPSTPMLIASVAAIIGLGLIAFATADSSAAEAGTTALAAESGTTALAAGTGTTGAPTAAGTGASGTGALTGAGTGSFETAAAVGVGDAGVGASGTVAASGLGDSAASGTESTGVGATSGVGPRAGAGLPATAGLGLLVAIASGIVYAASTAASRHTTQGVEPLDLTTLACVIGAVTMLPVAAVEGLTFAPGVGPIALLVYAGAITTALAYALFYMGLRHISGSVAVVVTLLEPLTAALLAVLLIDEPLGVATIIGGILLLGAVGTLYLDAGETSTQQPEAADARG